MNHGVFCISLDVEKYWGVHDVCSFEEASTFSQVDAITEKMLSLFQRYEIHATWATVGLLTYDSIGSLLKEKLEAIPYDNPAYSPFPLYSEVYSKANEMLLVGLDVLPKIINDPHQEWASHTFSHFYCLEPGVTEVDFKKDCQRMEQIARERGHVFKSIVFPRNQVNKDCLNVCADHQYLCYRGNQPNLFWKNSAYSGESFFKKAGRYIDAYFKFSRTKRFRPDQLENQGGLINIPASRFLRPYSGRPWLEKRKIRTIKKEMFQAARKKTIYHLWWHPHNFSKTPEIALSQLEELLAYATVLHEKFNFQSMNMGEIATYAKS